MKSQLSCHTCSDLCFMNLNSKIKICPKSKKKKICFCIQAFWSPIDHKQLEGTLSSGDFFFISNKKKLQVTYDIYIFV